MAKGKEATQALRRQYEGALAHIDRLTSELVDYKVRTRDCEADARKVSGLLAENDHLKSLIENQTSDEVNRLRTKRDERLNEAWAENDRLRTLVIDVIGRIPEDTACLSVADLEFLASRRLGAAVHLSANRELRRHDAAGKLNTDLNVQDNKRTAGNNVIPKIQRTGGISV